ncbi:MAG: 2,3-bisphosphoglycerate-independent phosphoglycerate mutase [Planctomycetes bacterium]|nr:2,3-bisphosphoglycerate-independent phosphoglycerate mutase [Planctomycetota bacterium]
MKYVMIIPHGAADRPVAELGGRTPLEAAATPNMDWVAQNGRQGTVATVPAGYAPGSDVGTMTLLGYRAESYYPGRGPLEAAAYGIDVDANDLILRCNLVTIVDGRMYDWTAGGIRTAEGGRLIDDLNANATGPGERFCAGVSYRHLLIMSDAADVRCDCPPPHGLAGDPIQRHRPHGPGSDRLCGLLDRAHVLLVDHDVNQVRRDLDENPATDIWLWGAGRHRSIPSFEDRHGLGGWLLASTLGVRGFGRLIGLTVADAPDSRSVDGPDHSAATSRATEALEHTDVAVIHIETPDQAGHAGDASAKMAALERIDAQIVGPMLDDLRRRNAWKMLIAPDHATPVADRTHAPAASPFCMAGTGIEAVVQAPFSETSARQTGLDIDPGHELIDYFFKR